MLSNFEINSPSVISRWLILGAPNIIRGAMETRALLLMFQLNNQSGSVCPQHWLPCSNSSKHFHFCPLTHWNTLRKLLLEPGNDLNQKGSPLFKPWVEPSPPCSPDNRGIWILSQLPAWPPAQYSSSALYRWRSSFPADERKSLDQWKQKKPSWWWRNISSHFWDLLNK